MGRYIVQTNHFNGEVEFNVLSLDEKTEEQISDGNLDLYEIAEEQFGHNMASINVFYLNKRTIDMFECGLIKIKEHE